MQDDSIPLVREFRIEGLHGYKDVTINFESPVKIVIAENGAGKTTILSALDSFLRGDFLSLRSINFRKISCLLRGEKRPIVIEKKWLINQEIPVNNETISEIAKYSNESESAVVSYLMAEFDSKAGDIRSNSIVNAYYLNSPYSWPDVLQRLSLAKSSIKGTISHDVLKILKRVKELMSGYEVLYLPTYRRIEKPSESRQSPRNRRGIAARRPHYKAALSSTKINYGLADVEERLFELSDEIQRRTNFGYRQISANIIDDLILKDFDIGQLSQAELPKLDQLETFFSRIGQDFDSGNDRFQRIKRFYDQVDSRGSNEENTAFLRYFLSKLSTVVNETSQLEGDIEQFVQKSNSYLESSSDPKRLVYNPIEMEVSVVNGWTESVVRLDELSSGEKQVVSLLAYLFLYPTKKIILIDEPELSLSIDWQQKILPDVASSPVCSQLLAITHSPFVFENELDEYASELDIKKTNREI